MTPPQALHSLAEEFYQWRYEENPVAASDAGRAAEGYETAADTAQMRDSSSSA